MRFWTLRQLHLLYAFTRDVIVRLRTGPSLVLGPHGRPGGRFGFLLTGVDRFKKGKLSHEGSTDRERCLAAGMDGYLSKLIRVEELESIAAGLAAPAAEN